MRNPNYDIITILGTTATGKTGLAVNLAKTLKSEIISADSRQIYRGMDIGTGKDLEEFKIDGQQIPYHLIDIKDPGYEYNVFEFQKDFFDCYAKLAADNKNAILCGGTGLYIESVLQSYAFKQVPTNEALRLDLESLPLNKLIERLRIYKGQLHNTTDTDSQKRCIRAIEIAEYDKQNPSQENSFPEINSINFGIRFPREVIRARITKRLKDRLENGMIEEAQNLLDQGTSHEQLEFYGLEYRYLSWFLSKQMTYDQMFEKLNISIHQFAKRQETWWRRMEKKGMKINWIDGNMDMNSKIDYILEITNNPIFNK